MHRILGVLFLFVQVSFYACAMDPYDLNRFVQAQAKNYGQVCAELKAGKKKSHWIWYIFPQIAGLGKSDTSKLYAIKSVDEAREYLAHPVLGKRLKECTEILLAFKGRSARDIFGDDEKKVRSSLTLFDQVSKESGSVFARALDTYFHGKGDTQTCVLLKNLEQPAVPKAVNTTPRVQNAQFPRGLLVFPLVIMIWLIYKYAGSQTEKPNKSPQDTVPDSKNDR